MKVTIKTLRGESHVIETESSETIQQLKEKVEKRLEVKAEFMKLIHKGCHLENSKNLEELNIKDGDTIILMVLKSHTLVSAPPVPSATPATPSPAVQPTPVPAPPSAQPVSASPQPPAQLDPNNEIVHGAQNVAQMVRELADMGFPVEEAERALIAAFYNRDRAVDYLLGGIPPNVAPATPGAVASAAAPQVPPAGQAAAPAPPAQIALTPSQMEQIQELVSAPQFEEIRQQAAQNPQVLQELMIYLQHNYPELLQLFQQNPALLLAVITGQYQLHPDVAEEGEEGEAIAELTPDDMLAIQMMQSFGFSAQQCVEAYLLCDKNQELAINYLLDEQNNAANQNN